VVSMILALHGFEVRCACYSKYLSTRDFESFRTMFEILGLIDDIKYGTFNEIGELHIYRNGDIREIIKGVILSGGYQMNTEITRGRDKKPQVLLIDEVDVFFSDSFYGNIYLPQTKI